MNGAGRADDEGTRPKTRKTTTAISCCWLSLCSSISSHFIYLLQRENAAGYYMRWLCVDNVGISLTNGRCLRDATAHALISLNKMSIPAIFVELHTQVFRHFWRHRSSNILDGRWKLGRKSHWKLIKSRRREIKSRSSQKLDVQAGLSFS